MAFSPCDLALGRLRVPLRLMSSWVRQGHREVCSQRTVFQLSNAWIRSEALVVWRSQNPEIAVIDAFQEWSDESEWM